MCARQESTGRREKEPVGPRHRRTAGSSPQDGKFVPKHDNLQILKIGRPKPQGSKLQNPSTHHVTEREEHEPSNVARQLPDSTPQPSDSASSGPFGRSRNVDLCTLHGSTKFNSFAIPYR